MFVRPLKMGLMVGVLLLAWPACSQPRLTSSTKPVELGPGASFVVKKVAGAKEFELKLVFFDEALWTLRVAANPDRKNAKGLEAMARDAGAAAACNGGYFTPQFGPIGLEIADGVRGGEFDRNNPLFGTLAVKDGAARLFKDNEITDDRGMTDLVQCCPRLMEGGLAEKGIGGDDRAPRTFVLTDNAGHWAFGVSNGIGLQELANLLAVPGVITEFKPQRALNLDGGPSSGLWYQDAKGETHYQKEAWPVRNMLLLIPRKK
jgi:Phosphodiester glycosidase